MSIYEILDGKGMRIRRLKDYPLSLVIFKA